jgi:FkbM family methyltransferase
VRPERPLRGRPGDDAGTSKRLSRLMSCALQKWGHRLSLADRRALRRQLAGIAELDFSEHMILLHADSATESQMRAWSCKKEPGTIDWLRKELRAGDVFYDVGANVGAYSLVAAKLTSGRAQVMAFEPGFQNYAQLCRNIILNRCEDSIVPIPLPLSRETRLERFHYENLEEGGALHSFSRRLDYKAEEFVPVVSLGAIGFSLDELARVAGLPPPHLLKIDVDGMERQILLGAAETLAREDLRSILLEINEDLSDEASGIMSCLWERGLEPREKHPLTRKLYNYVFIRRRSGRPPASMSDVPVSFVRNC